MKTIQVVVPSWYETVAKFVVAKEQKKMEKKEEEQGCLHKISETS